MCCPSNEAMPPDGKHGCTGVAEGAGKAPAHPGGEAAKAEPTQFRHACWIRVAAYFIDAAIMMLIIVVLILAAKYSGLLPYTNEYAWDAVGIVVGWLYFASQESSAAQGTVGKRVVGVVVVDYDGRRISFGRASVRFFAKLFTNLIAFLGFLMIALTKKYEGMYDLIAGTYVVYADKSEESAVE